MEYTTSQKILRGDALRRKLHYWRFHSQQIVFTNGCFDLVHLGHVDYLERARALGDCLIIGLNTDYSIRQIKGPERPLQPQESRARLLAAFEFVDAVVLFDEPAPYRLIENVQPDILVKGNDYTIEQITGADLVLARGGEVKTLELISGHSTSALIERIRGQSR